MPRYCSPLRTRPASPAPSSAPKTFPPSPPPLPGERACLHVDTPRNVCRIRTFTTSRPCVSARRRTNWRLEDSQFADRDAISSAICGGIARPARRKPNATDHGVFARRVDGLRL
jgi:hypothetical protein